MVEPTHLKNISQIGNLPQIGVKIKNIRNHHLDFLQESVYHLTKQCTILQGKSLKITTKTSRRMFFRACVFTIFLPHIWNGFIFFCVFYNVFLVQCIVLVSEMLSFTMVTKLNYFLICKLHRFVWYEVVSKASRGSLLQQWFIRFLVFFNPMFSENEFFYITGLDMCKVCTEAVHSVAL